MAFPWYFKDDLEFIHSTFYSMYFYPTIFRFSVLPTRHSRAIRKRSRSAVSRRLQSATQSQENEKVSRKIIHGKFTFSSFTKLDYFWNMSHKKTIKINAFNKSNYFYRLEKEYLAKRTKEQEEAVELRVSHSFWMFLLLNRYFVTHQFLIKYWKVNEENILEYFEA